MILRVIEVVRRSNRSETITTDDQGTTLYYQNYRIRYLDTGEPARKMNITAIDQQSKRCKNVNLIPNKYKRQRGHVAKVYKPQLRDIRGRFLWRPAESNEEITEWDNQYSRRTTRGVVDILTRYGRFINYKCGINS